MPSRPPRCAANCHRSRARCGPRRCSSRPGRSPSAGPPSRTPRGSRSWCSPPAGARAARASTRTAPRRPDLLQRGAISQVGFRSGTGTVLSGVVPDGVASVTLHFPAQSGGANPAPPIERHSASDQKRVSSFASHAASYRRRSAVPRRTRSNGRPRTAPSSGQSTRAPSRLGDGTRKEPGISKRRIAALAIALHRGCAGAWRRPRITVAGLAVAVLAAGCGGFTSTTSSTSAAHSRVPSSTASAHPGWTGMGGSLSAFPCGRPHTSAGRSRLRRRHQRCCLRRRAAV